MSERTVEAAWLGAASRRPRRRLDAALLTALLLVLGLLIVALFGDRIAPHESIYFVVEHGSDPRPYEPGLVFPFGSDVLGRDLFSLVLAGARATLTIVFLAGLARVFFGLAIAALGGWWRLLRSATESIAEFVSAVPATLVALVLVKVFVKGADASVLVFIGALLVTGWAGPYRVVRAELDRLSQAPFTEGATAIGAGRGRLFWHHHVPHLVPTVAMNLSQQIVASLVLLAELGVLGVFVGATRAINVEESLSRVVTGSVNSAQIADPPEWGGLLAGARTIESLWTTRWLIFVPGISFALTGIAVAVIGLAVSRRYARRDVTDDLRSHGAAGVGLAVVAIFAVAALVPPRYAAATAWAADARGAMQPSGGSEATFLAGGLLPLGTSYAIQRSSSAVGQTGAATVTVGPLSIVEKWPRDPTLPTFTESVRSFVTQSTGGGVVEAPLVFAARGISPSDYPPPTQTTLYGGKLPELGDTIKDYPDDYAGIDVRGKVVLLVRFFGVKSKLESPNIRVAPNGIGVQESIENAIRHGAAAVLFVDPSLPYYSDRVLPYTSGFGAFDGGVNPYYRAEQDGPPMTTAGVPVIVLSDKAAAGLASANGIDLGPLLGKDEPGAWVRRPSVARDLGVSARVSVPLKLGASTTTSYAAEVEGVAHETGHVLVWAQRRPGDPHPAADVLGALANTLAPRRAPFIFVDFDGSGDSKANAHLIREALGDRRIALVVVLGDLTGEALKLTTPHGELIPALDLYAGQAGARAAITRSTSSITSLDGIAPFADLPSVLVDSAGGSGDLRPDVSAFVGYLAGRLALGAEELPK